MLVYKRTLWFCTVAAMFWTGMSIAQEKKLSTSDRHLKRNIACTGCHGESHLESPTTQTACLTCHKSLEAVAERTKDFNYNPHRNHLTNAGEVACLRCHQGHKEDILACSQCHEGIKFERK
jgi:hypothetical protein